MRSTPKRGKQTTVLNIDMLEDRSLPSGNVTAYVKGGVLWVNTSAADTGIWVNATSSSSVVIKPYGSADSTINGSASPLSLGGIDFAYSITMSGRDDFLYISGASGGLSVIVNMPGGGDGLAMMNNKYSGATAVDLGSGGNVLAIGGDKFSGTATFSLAGDNNQVSLSTTQFAAVSFLGGTGSAPNSLALQEINFHDKPLVSNFGYVWHSLTPHADDVSASVAQGSSVSINLADSSQAISGTLNTSSVVITSEPAHGTVVNNGDGSVTFTSTGTATGVDTFTYTIQNSTGAVSNEGTVFVNVTAPPGPSTSITSTAGSTTNLSSIPVTVTFSQSVTGFTQSAVTVTNGTISNFAGSGSSYTFDIAPTADGVMTVKVPADVATNSSSKENTASNTLSITVDRTPPTVSVSSTAATPTNVDAIPVTITFSKSVTSFTSSGVTVTNGTIADFAGSGTTYTLNVLPTADGVVTVAVPASSAKDSAGNENSASNTLSVTSQRTDPVVTVNPLTTNALKPTLTGTVSDASASVSVVVGGQTIAASVIDNNWSAAVPIALTAGSYNIVAKATDFAGNASTTTSTDGLVINTTAPTVTINSPTDPTTTATPTLTGTVSEANSTVLVTVGGQTITATVTGKTWSATVPTALANGTYTVAASATDPAGNVGSDTATNALVIDVSGVTANPQVTVNPLTTNTLSPTLTGTVSDTNATVSVSVGGQLLNATVNGNVWSLSNIPALTADTYTVTATATDGENVGTGTAQLVISTTDPTVTAATITATTATPTLNGTVSESNATVSVSVAGQTFVATVSGTNWTATVPTAVANGTYSVTVTATDAAGNVGTATVASGLTVNVASSSTLPFSLTDNAWQTLSSGVRYWDVTTGTGTAIKAGDNIVVNYIGYLTNGTVFDSSFSRNQTFSTPLTTASLIAGWVDGIPGMKPGGERRLDIPASLAYGDTAQGSIPANSELVFDITMISATS
jgi:FKBP-type peptidyl-prolyl cis-trans isomerase